MWTALVIVYVVWGSTYLAIRVMVETVPPLLGAGARFLLAGALMWAFLRAKNGRARVTVSARELVSTATVGTAMLLGGNGLVNVAEQDVPSGLAALIVSSVPLWVVVWRSLARERASRATLIGVVAGFAGVAILVLPGGEATGAGYGGSLLIVLASALWATGSFFSVKLTMPSDAFVATAYEMLFGGAAALIAGVARGEATSIDFGAFSGTSIAAFFYLVVAGSLVAFTAYVWLLHHAPISKVATYAYVNPVVAVGLGALVLAEPLTPAIVAGAVVIVGAVAFTVRHESLPADADEGVISDEPVIAGARGPERRLGG